MIMAPPAEAGILASSKYTLRSMLQLKPRLDEVLESYDAVLFAVLAGRSPGELETASSPIPSLEIGLH